MLMGESKYLKWLRTWKDVLSIGKIEEKNGLPPTTLHHFLSNRRSLTEDQKAKIEHWVKDFLKLNVKKS